MSWPVHNVNGINLQATLAAASASADYVVSPHHPITCGEELRLEEDGAFACPHKEVPPSDPRLRHCLVTSIAYLIIEHATRL